MENTCLEFPEIPSGRGDDLHNLQWEAEADLILFMAGNQFMVMEELVADFRERHPSVGRIFYETLPPGLELRQILAGGARFGERVITGRPDVYASVTDEAMERLVERSIVGEYQVYLHNRLSLMVQKGNPKGIRGVEDLARKGVVVSQPGEMEDITTYIKEMYVAAGGDDLLGTIMEEKMSSGSTLKTVVHHRETPERITQGKADVGPVWATEIQNAIREGLDVEAVEPGSELDMRQRVNYNIARLNDAPNPQNAMTFLEYIMSERAQAIYEGYGFVPHRG